MKFIHQGEMKLTIIDKYIIKELLSAFFSVIFVLLLIVLSTEVVHLLKWVSQGVIPLSALLSYLSNSVFEFGVILIPLSLLMGILMAFGRLYHDSEMAAIMSAGIGPMQWYRPLMVVAVPLTLLLLILLLFVQPLIAYQRELIKADMRSQVEVDKLIVGQFNQSNKNDGVLFLESESDTTHQVENVFFQQHRDNKGGRQRAFENFDGCLQRLILLRPQRCTPAQNEQTNNEQDQEHPLSDESVESFNNIGLDGFRALCPDRYHLL